MMALAEIKILCETCMDYCKEFEFNPEDYSKECIHLQHCEQVRTVVIQRIYDAFEEELGKSLGKESGLKEPSVWQKAIAILEDLMDE